MKSSLFSWKLELEADAGSLFPVILVWTGCAIMLGPSAAGRAADQISDAVIWRRAGAAQHRANPARSSLNSYAGGGQGTFSQSGAEPGDGQDRRRLQRQSGSERRAEFGRDYATGRAGADEP